MPFDTSRPLSDSPAVLAVSEHDRPAPGFMDTVSAAFQQSNLIGSILSSQARATPDFHRVEAGYDVFDDIAGYEQFSERFEDVYNPIAAAAVKADIDREQRNRQTLQAAGFMGFGLELAASVADPTILIPGGTFYRASKVGYDVVRTGASVVAMAGLATTLQETGLHATQRTRTVEESALAIGGSVLLGGIVGTAGAKFLTHGEWKRIGDNLRAELADEVPDPVAVTDTIVKRMQAAGADVLDEASLADLGIEGTGKAAEIVARATAAARINPGIQTMFSPSREVREAYAKLVDMPVYTRMNMEGRTVGPAVENLVKLYQRGALGQWIKEARKLYGEAKKAGYTGSRSQFYVDVAHAGRRGDVDPRGNPFVSKAARSAREKVFDPLLERAIKGKLLPEDVTTTTAASYVTRLWNRQRLIAQEDQFREIAAQYFREELAKVPADQRPDFLNEADVKSYIDDVVMGVFNNLTGRGKGDTPEWLVPVTRGPLKERTFGIADELVEDFLENDMEQVLRFYTRTMGAEVELAEKFGRADMRDQFEAINREYDELSKAAGTEKERLALDAARKRDLRNMTAFRDMVRGTYRGADEAPAWNMLTQSLLTYNYMRLLGGVAVTSLTDLMRPIGVFGLRAVMREALPALVSNVKAAKISRRDARDLGAVTEVVLQSRLASLADLNDPYREASAYERWLANASNLFSKATGLGVLNDTTKTVVSVMTQNRMARNALNWAGAGKDERAWMAMVGIDETMSQRIADQLGKHGIQERNIWGANVEAWDDDVAARGWAAALNRNVDRTIVTKGISDTPLFMKTNWGRLIMQFKSFALASHQRVLIAGLQEKPHRLAEQMVIGTALGMMIAWLKYQERNSPDEAQKLLDNPGMWIADGLDRTGILSVPFELSNTFDALQASYGGPNIGLTRLASMLAGDKSEGGPTSRYASRNATAAIFGPSVGMIEDLTNISAGVLSTLGGDGMNRSQTNALFRQLPGGSLPLVRSAIHYQVKPAIQE